MDWHVSGEFGECLHVGDGHGTIMGMGIAVCDGIRPGLGIKRAWVRLSIF